MYKNSNFHFCFVDCLETSVSRAISDALQPLKDESGWWLYVTSGAIRDASLELAAAAPLKSVKSVSLVNRALRRQSFK
jgi:hypothetical protein